jgi:hypothetical protein
MQLADLRHWADIIYPIGFLIVFVLGIIDTIWWNHKKRCDHIGIIFEDFICVIIVSWFWPIMVLFLLFLGLPAYLDERKALKAAKSA